MSLKKLESVEITGLEGIGIGDACWLKGGVIGDSTLMVKVGEE